jgi:hypothetical protein
MTRPDRTVKSFVTWADLRGGVWGSLARMTTGVVNLTGRRRQSAVGAAILGEAHYYPAPVRLPNPASGFKAEFRHPPPAAAEARGVDQPDRNTSRAVS